MEIDFENLSSRERYKLLVGFIIPRPIAFVTTVGRDGVPNAAPFSFFNVFGEDPATVVLGIQVRPDGSLKDTARNILETGEYVINMVDEAIAEAMNVCAVDFPAVTSELEPACLTLEPSRIVKPGRIVQSPVSFECRHLHSITFRPDRSLFIGEVVWMRARDEVIDPQTLRLRPEAYHPVGRLYGNMYSRQSERFEMVRQTYAEWQKERGIR
jgi:flavin reductase (DIM6/NTAB) family NADH-FMN oxidoreductase RutF